MLGEQDRVVWMPALQDVIPLQLPTTFKVLLSPFASEGERGTANAIPQAKPGSSRSGSNEHDAARRIHQRRVARANAAAWALIPRSRPRRSDRTLGNLLANPSGLPATASRRRFPITQA
jgi:hypothetical protein